MKSLRRPRQASRPSR